MAESESIKRVLEAHTYSNIPKKKNARQQNLPTGKDRFDPTSPAWIGVLEKQEEKKKKIANKKEADKTVKSNSDKNKKNTKRKLRI